MKIYMTTAETLPPHLRRYIVEQDYEHYTAIDQATWRYIMRQLRSHLVKFAHECYLEGLEKTGITTDQIPRIEDISRHISRFGWRAVPVSGFIPPAAFMELQSLGYLPIAQDMRSIEHLTYTPAPDIVHEAAGHAPILVNAEFADYLREYAQVARKAIISKEDLDLYNAIRKLSDLKEHPQSTQKQIDDANRELNQRVQNMSHISEAALLARMNWWTAEYGLIGNEKSPRIYGAGLLSSVAESRGCYGDSKVKKLPLTIKCLEYSYDITEPQPQLFVTPDFKTLKKVLHEMADTMAYRQGGTYGLDKILKAGTVNTLEYNSGLQVSGVLTRVLEDKHMNRRIPVYFQFQGPVQLSFHEKELPGHNKQRHPEGFGSPVGLIKGSEKCLSLWTEKELTASGLMPGKKAELVFQSGVKVAGLVKSIWAREGRNILITWQDCHVSSPDEAELFNPSWGEYDMAVGSTLPSVFGGPADREKYGPLDDFVARRVPPQPLEGHKKHLDGLYKTVRQIREREEVTEMTLQRLEKIFDELKKDFPDDWLLSLEIFELSQGEKLAPIVEKRLQELTRLYPSLKGPIEDGVNLARHHFDS